MNHKQIWLGSNEASKVLFYKRCVDDIICFFDSEEKVE